MTTNISIIVALAKNRAIGKSGQLIWHLPNDLKHFKNVTSGYSVIMGYHTYMSLPEQRPLPKRRNIILSSRMETAPEGFELAPSINDALKLCSQEEEVFIIGGGMIYEQFLPLADKLYLTRLDKSFEADTYFPYIDYEQWDLIDLEVFDDDSQVDFSYRFEVWERKE
jgi:Dihydrofolate reductase